jgi:hypothetical protein
MELRIVYGITQLREPQYSHPVEHAVLSLMSGATVAAFAIAQGHQEQDVAIKAIAAGVLASMFSGVAGYCADKIPFGVQFFRPVTAFTMNKHRTYAWRCGAAAALGLTLMLQNKLQLASQTTLTAPEPPTTLSATNKPPVGSVFVVRAGHSPAGPR